MLQDIGMSRVLLEHSAIDGVRTQGMVLSSSGAVEAQRCFISLVLLFYIARKSIIFEDSSKRSKVS